jgi:hypothetical protein
MYCDNCGKEHPETAMFCDDCGSDLSGDAGSDQPTAGTQGGDQYDQGGGHQQGGAPQQGGGQYNQGAGHQQGGTPQQGGGQYNQGGAPQQGGQGGGYQQGSAPQQGGQGGGYQQGGQGGGQYNQGPQYGGGAPQDTDGLTVRTEADKYLKKFATYNLVLGILTAFFGLIAIAITVFAGGMMMQSAMPTAASGVFGAAMAVVAVFVVVFAGLYFATWHFAKKRSAVAVYGMTGLLALGTLFNAITLNIIGFPIALLGAYWGYKSFDAV